MPPSSDDSISSLSGWPVPFINPFADPIPISITKTPHASQGPHASAPKPSEAPSASGAKPGKSKPKGAAKLHGAGNCGTGHGGFKPGNTCGKTGRARLAERIKSARLKAKAGEISHKELRATVKDLKNHRRGKHGAISNDVARIHHATIRGHHQDVIEAPHKNPEGHAKRLAAASTYGAKPAKVAKAKPAKPAKPKTPKPPAEPKNTPHPDKLTGYTPLGGSTGAELAHDSKGNKYVVKKGKNEGHIREESHADRLYEALGIPVAKHTLHETNAGPVKVARHIEGTELGKLAHSDPAAHAKAIEEVKKHFVADALLGNWDVAGMNHDNILVDKSGKVHRIDNGGALRYRAQGALKADHQWGEMVGEINSMRHGHNNPGATSIFGSLTDKEVAKQIGQVVKKKDKILEAAPAHLKDTLRKRIDWLGSHKTQLEANAKVAGATQKLQAKTDAKLAKKAAAHQAKVDKFQAANPGKPLPKHLAKGTQKPESDFKNWEGKVDQGDQQLKAHFEPWAKSLPLDEKIAVKDFTGSGYHKINGHIWNPSNSYNPQAAEAKIKHIESALGKTHLPEDTALFRALKYDGAQAVGVHDPTSLIPGQTLHMTGFKSTTIDPDFAAGWGGSGGALFKILAPKGTKGAYVNGNGLSYHNSEKEFLLPHSTQKFKVLKVEPSPIAHGPKHVITLGIDHA